MTKYTDEEVDAVALAILNSDMADVGLVLFSSLEQVFSPDSYRRIARAALAARDALFETVGERWVIRGPRGFWCRDTQAEAHALAEEKRAAGVTVRVSRITTKRRKR